MLSKHYKKLRSGLPILLNLRNHIFIALEKDFICREADKEDGNLLIDHFVSPPIYPRNYIGLILERYSISRS